MQNFITKDQWMLLDIPTKQKLVAVFGINKSGFSEVRDSIVVTDGYTQEDLKVITLEKMNEYIGSEEATFLRAWEITLSKINFELNPPVAEIKGVNEKTGTVVIEEVKPAEAPKVEEKVEEVTKTNETKNAETKKSK